MTTFPNPWKPLLAAVSAVVLGACFTEIPDLATADAQASDAGASDSADTGSPDAAIDVDPEVSLPPCPDDMVHATDETGNVSFCIERTEVTQTKYIEFLAAVGADPDNTEQPAECAFNQKLSNSPDGTCPDFATNSEKPVYCVDWCDAYAYCAFRGRRLCGKIGGGSLDYDAIVATDEWHFACTGGLKTTYPYGDEDIVGACNIPQENTPNDSSDDLVKAPVGSFPECEGGFPGIFDMQGNVAEWTDRCEPGDGSGAENCMTRGGHTYSTAAYWRCNNMAEVLAMPRNEENSRVTGFRCCADAR